MAQCWAGLRLSFLRAAAIAPPPGADPDTQAWWAITGELSSDAMEGRDTGSSGYNRAAKYVAARFEKAGLKPAGERGTWYQTLPLKEVRVEKAGTTFSVYNAGPENAQAQDLKFLHQISVRATDELPASIEAALELPRLLLGGRDGRGHAGQGGRLLRRAAARHDQRRRSAEGRRRRRRNRPDKRGRPGFTIEPSRWPDAYARSISFRDAPAPASPRLAVMRLSADALPILVGKEQAQTILTDGAASKPLPVFDTSKRLKATFSLSRRELASDNVLGLLPGTDPALAPQVVVVSAHLDGYGFGEAVGGDTLYNGAFDDAAYVATLIRLAEQRQGKGFRRSVLFAAFTGEEKGLLGATWFTQNPTVPKAEPRCEHQSRSAAPAVPAEDSHHARHRRFYARRHGEGLGGGYGHRDPARPGTGAQPQQPRRPLSLPAHRRAGRRASSSASIPERRPSGAIANGIRSAITVRRTT